MQAFMPDCLNNLLIWLAWSNKSDGRLPDHPKPLSMDRTPTAFCRLNGKKGACFTLRSPGKEGSWIENLPKILDLCPCWTYSWGVSRLPILPKRIQFLPMLWGYYGDENLTAQVKRIINQGSQVLLAFNEPDKASQSNVDVDKAIEVWRLLDKLDLFLVSPSCADADGDWMESFMGKVEEQELRVDAIGVHSYGAPNARSFQDRLKRIHRKYNRNILITEFAVADWDANTPEDNRFPSEDVLEFMRTVLPWLEHQHWIIGYAWFSFEEDNPFGTSSALFRRDGSLTPLGNYYSTFSFR